MELIITEKKSPKFVCEKCDYKSNKQSEWNKHINRAKHIASISESAEKTSSKEFSCELCNFKCYKNSDLIDHLNRPKHIKNLQKNDIINIKYICEKCKREYKSQNGLWKHNNKNECMNKEEVIDSNVLLMTILKENTDFKTMIMDLVKNNTDLQKQMLELCKNNNTTNNNNNTTINATDNSNNSKTFNLQVFLNEKCKDAMNLDDFANSIELNLSDLIRIGEEGYIPGMSKVFIERLVDTEVCKSAVMKNAKPYK